MSRLKKVADYINNFLTNTASKLVDKWVYLMFPIDSNNLYNSYAAKGVFLTRCQLKGITEMKWNSWKKIKAQVLMESP